MKPTSKDIATLKAEKPEGYDLMMISLEDGLCKPAWVRFAGDNVVTAMIIGDDLKWGGLLGKFAVRPASSVRPI